LKKFFIFQAILFFAVSFTAAQEADLIDIPKDDIDLIFGDPPTVSEEPAETKEEPKAPEAKQPAPAQPKQPAQPASVIRDVRRRGLEFTGSYLFRGAINPGWNIYPWDFDGSEEFSWAIALKMRGTIGLNARISESFRVYNSFRFEMPAGTSSSLSTTISTNPNTGVTTVTVRESTYNPVFSFVDFYLDYNFYDKVFLRAGRFSQSWGVSRNFAFSNILARIPQTVEGRNSRSGPSYIVKFDIPIGVGGLQLLAMTRVNIAGNITPIREDIGYGGKYNLAFNWADFDLGFYWQEGMAARGFLSVKTNQWNTDFYNEWLAVINTQSDNSFEYGFNLGFTKRLLKNRFDINGEFFYNNEDVRNEYFMQETEFRVEGTSRLPLGANLALNLNYRFDAKMNPRVFARFRYSVTEDSINLVPGFRFTPFTNLNVYLAVPVALGSKDGFYYKDSKNVLQEIRPFSFLLYVTFSGSIRVSQYY